MSHQPTTGGITKKKKKMERSYNWCFTINNPTPEDYSMCESTPHKYLIIGTEGAAEGATPHIQGYIKFGSQRTRSGVAKMLPRAHLEITKGTPQQAADYCKKEGNFVEHGTPPKTPKQKGQLEKDRYQKAWDLAKQGKIEEIDADIRYRLYSTTLKIAAMYQKAPPSLPTLDFHWYYGDSGTGKSRKAREENPDAYIKNANKWWDGYVDQPCVIIEEWSPDHECLASHLKQWADHHPFCAENKGGTMCIRPPKLIITSNFSIAECFEKHQNREPLERRFKPLHFSKDHPFKTTPLFSQQEKEEMQNE